MLTQRRSRGGCLFTELGFRVGFSSWILNDKNRHDMHNVFARDEMKTTCCG